MNFLLQILKPDHVTNRWLYTFELSSLVLMALMLPSFEAPKNIFLLLYVIFASIRQFKEKPHVGWASLDTAFLVFIASGLLSAYFAGFAGGDEWKGFRVILTYISVGWLVSRAGYSAKTLCVLLGMVVLGVIPPLIWGAYLNLWTHQKHYLELHSVGHVNHSAIYLAIVFGAALGACLTGWKRLSNPMRWGVLILSVLDFAGLVVQESRGALGVAIALAVLLVVLLSRSKNVIFAFLLTLSLSVAGLYVGHAQVVEKQKYLQKGDIVLSYRDLIWHVSLEASHFHPVLGIGMDNWKLITPAQIQASVEARHGVYDPKYYLFGGHSHNLYLNTLVEKGYVGLAALLLLMFTWLWTLIKRYAYLKTDAAEACFWAASFSAWLVTFGVGAVNTTLHHEHGILAILMLGLHLAYVNKLKQR